MKNGNTIKPISGGLSGSLKKIVIAIRNADQAKVVPKLTMIALNQLLANGAYMILHIDAIPIINEIIKSILYITILLGFRFC